MSKWKFKKPVGKLWDRCVSVLLAGCMVVTGGFFAPPVASQAQEAPTVTWVMSQEGNYWQEQAPLTTAAWDAGSHSELYIDVDENVTYQKMAEEIWGGCFNERGWQRLLMLTEEEREHILDLLFDPNEEDGLKLTLGRIPIGASDFGLDLYTLDDVEGDYELEHFSIERDKSETGIIPYIKAALKRNPDMKLWASPWSPPAWLKDNNSLIGGHINYTEQNMATYAQYFKKFIEAYKAEGIHISMVSPQNEPTMWTLYTSCVWTGDQLRDFIRDHLGPVLEGTGVEIYLGTFTNSNDSLMDSTLNDPASLRYTDGITFQWWSYFKSHSLYNSGFDLGMMQSETMCGDGNNNWQYAENQFDIMWMYLSTGISAYNLWNMVLEWDGVNPGGHNTANPPWPQNAPITVNETTKQYTINPHFYEYKHFTNFVKPGAYRIASTGTYDEEFPLIDEVERDDRYSKELHEIAFRNPDGTNVLMVKNGSNTVKHVDINFNGRMVSVDLPAHSIHTFTAEGTPLTGNETDHRAETEGYMPADQLVRIENKATGQALCIEGEGGVVKNQAHVFNWQYSGQANQEWYLEPSSVDGTETVKLVNRKSSKIVAVDDGSKADGAKLIQWPYTGGADQNWIVEEAQGGYIRFRNANSGHYLSGPQTAQAEQKADNATDDHQLWKITNLAVEDLASVIAYGEEAAAVTGIYREASINALNVALEAAKAADTSNTEAALQAKGSVEQALKGLVRPTDKESLKQAVARAAQKDEDEFTQESWRSLQAALEDARKADADALATQQQVNKAECRLNLALLSLESASGGPAAADKKALAQAIQSASAKIESDYTAESWSKFKKALEDAKAVNGKADATQAEVNAAKEALEKAGKELVPIPQEGQSTVTWVMSQENNYWKEQAPLTTTTWDEANHSSLYIDVDETITYQKMAEEIWGGCFNERGWKRLLMLTEEERDHILDLLFDPDEPEGLHLTLGRIPIGASDFANTLYSLDDLPDGVTSDYDLEYFSIERDKSETGIIPFIKEALKRNPDMKFWASPWSPPAWMKDNNNLIAGNIVYNDKNMATYAQYFKKFIEAYRAEGIDVSMVSPQNEPTMWTLYTSCIWTGQQLCDFIRDHLGPVMEELGVEIYLGTFTNSSDSMMDAALKDPEARKYLSGVTFQWWSYFKSHSLYNTGFNRGMMQSETMCGNGRNDWQYAENQFDVMWMYLSTGISAYNLWNMVLEWDGVNPGGHNTANPPWPQNAPITVNDNTKEYRINPHYYEYKHFTNFIQPGARRISSTGTFDAEFPMVDEVERDDRYARELHEIAFRNPDGTNVLMVKNGSNSVKHVDINFNGRKISVDLPAHSIHTFQTEGTPLTGNETDMRDQLPEYIPSDQIVTLQNKATGQALGVESGSVKDGAKVIQWDYTKEANQEWYLAPVEGKEHKYKLVNTKSGKIVAADGGKTDDGTKMLQWHYEGAGHTEQHWVLEEDEATGACRLKNEKSGHYLSVSGAKGSQAEQKADNKASDNQVWEITYVNTGNTPSVNKAELEKAIQSASAKAEKDYTKESWTKFKKALEDAKAIQAKANATQAEVDAALTALNQAVLALVPAVVSADKKALEEAIKSASAKAESNYTKESWTKFKKALEDAKAIQAKENATQTEVNAALTSLNQASQALVPVQKPISDPIKAPASVKASWTGTKNIKVSWGKAPNAEKYEVYRSYKKNSSYKKIATVKGKVSYTDKKASAGKNVYYKVIAVRGAKKSTYSKASSAAYIVKTPASVTVKAGKKKATVSFKKSSKASGYQIYRATKKNGKYKKVADLKAKQAKKTFTKMKKGTYYYKVRAYKTISKKKIYTAFTSPKRVKVK